MIFDRLTSTRIETQLPKVAMVIALACTQLACEGGPEHGGPDEDFDGDGVINAVDIDDDNDGLIEIATLQELDWIRNSLTGEFLEDHRGNRMTEGCSNFSCNGYELVADLDFDTNADGVMDEIDTYYDYDRDGFNRGWLPIGASRRNAFNANFHGNNRRISNLYINREFDQFGARSDYVGLFGVVLTAPQVEISDLILDGELMSVTGGGSDVGALAGTVRAAAISNVSVTGTVNGMGNRVGGLAGSTVDVTITDGHFTGQVSGGQTGQGENSGSTGGLVGSINNTSIGNSSSNGAVTGMDFTGGLVGSTNVKVFANVVPEPSVISSSHSGASVIGNNLTGGLVGGADGNSVIEDSYATGSVIGADATGGLVGSVNFGLAGVQDDAVSSIDNSFATGSVRACTGGSSGRRCTKYNYVGGLIGISYFLNLTDTFATGEVRYAGRFVAGLVGDANRGSVISRSFAANTTVQGDTDVGMLVGWSDGASYLGNYYTSDTASPALRGIGRVAGASNIGVAAEVTGDTLSNLKSVTAAGQNGLYFNWGAEWDFGDSTQLPGLVIDGVVYRDGNADGVLD